MRGMSLVLYLLLMPIALAGSPDDPEIRDNAGDVRVSVPFVFVDVPSGAGPPREALDIIATWFHGETNSSISVTMLVADLSGVDEWDDPSLGFIRWGTRFELTNYDATSDDYWENTWIMGVNLVNGEWRASLSPPSRDGDLQPNLPATFAIDRAEGTLTVTVNRMDLGKPMAGDAMTETLSLHDATWGPGPYGINYHDQSPDGTYPSRDFVFQLDTGEHAVVQTSPSDSQEHKAPISSEPPENDTPVSTVAVLLAIFYAARRGRFNRAEW